MQKSCLSLVQNCPKREEQCFSSCLQREPRITPQMRCLDTWVSKNQLFIPWPFSQLALGPCCRQLGDSNPSSHIHPPHRWLALVSPDASVWALNHLSPSLKGWPDERSFFQRASGHIAPPYPFHADCHRYEVVSQRHGALKTKKFLASVFVRIGICAVVS